MLVQMMLIAFICVFIVDMAKIPTQIIDWVYSHFLKARWEAADGGRNMWKPWECSLCMTWWVSLIYVFFSPAYTFLAWETFACAALCAFMAEPICHIMHCVKDILGITCNRITERLENGRKNS